MEEQEPDVSHYFPNNWQYRERTDTTWRLKWAFPSHNYLHLENKFSPEQIEYFFDDNGFPLSYRGRYSAVALISPRGDLRRFFIVIPSQTRLRQAKILTMSEYNLLYQL